MHHRCLLSATKRFKFIVILRPLQITQITNINYYLSRQLSRVTHTSIRYESSKGPGWWEGDTNKFVKPSSNEIPVREQKGLPVQADEEWCALRS